MEGETKKEDASLCSCASRWLACVMVFECVCVTLAFCSRAHPLHPGDALPCKNLALQAAKQAADANVMHEPGETPTLMMNLGSRRILFAFLSIYLHCVHVHFYLRPFPAKPIAISLLTLPGTRLLVFGPSLTALRKAIFSFPLFAQSRRASLLVHFLSMRRSCHTRNPCRPRLTMRPPSPLCCTTSAGSCPSRRTAPC